jgi:hypothetical protein
VGEALPAVQQQFTICECSESMTKMYKGKDIGTANIFQMENTDFYFVAVGSKLAIMAANSLTQKQRNS